MDSGVVVTSIGMVTALGHWAEASCAAIRAGISRLSELVEEAEEDEVDEEPEALEVEGQGVVLGCPAHGLTDGYLGLGRWTRMAALAVEDLVENSGLAPQQLAAARLYLALPSLETAGMPEDSGTSLATRIGKWIGLRRLGERPVAHAEGSAAGVLALDQAIQDLRAGGAEFAIVGGVDSLLEPARLGALGEAGRLKNDQKPDGLVPGEAAAFVLLETAEHALERGARGFATLEATATARETKTIWADEPPDGAGLAEALTACFSQLGDGGTRTGLVICDLNGETFRAKEFANVIPRVLSCVQVPWQLWHPADCIGDTGAASALVAAVLVARALRQGYAPSDDVLVWASSDGGLRGSFYMRRLEGESWA